MGKKDKKAGIKKLKKMVLSPKDTVETFRKKFENEFYSPFIPNHVECTTEIINGIKCYVLRPEIYSKDRIMIYVHGGCFIGGSCNSYRSFCASLAHASNTKIILPSIRLAPKHPYPAALEDIKYVLRSLFTEKPQILIGADGSGASLALALAFSLKGKYRKKLQQIVLFSPWLDISNDSEVIKYPKKKSTDKIITPSIVLRCAEFYTYTSNHIHPHVSPMYAPREMLEELPEIYIQMGEDELLSQDVLFFENKLRKAHVQCTIDIWKDMVFMFQFADECFEESHLAIEMVGKHIKNTELKEDLGDTNGISCTSRKY